MHNSKSKCRYNAKPSAYYFYVKTNISVPFQICISTSTAGNVSKHGNSNSCSKAEQIALPANSERIKAYFCSDAVFNLSHKVLSQTEISVLEKGLGFVPTTNMINEADLTQNFHLVEK